MTRQGRVRGDGAQRPFQIVNIARWSLAEWLVVLGFGGFFVLLAQWGAPSASEKETLRSQFHLPAPVTLSELKVKRHQSWSTPPTIEAVAQFSEPEFKTYLASLGDPRVWRPQPLQYARTVYEGSHAPDAFSWQDLPVKRQLAWGSLSSQRAQAVRTGKYLCFVVQQQVDRAGAAAPDRTLPCSQATSSSATSVFVQGLIDAETKTLHMLVRAVRAPSRPDP